MSFKVGFIIPYCFTKYLIFKRLNYLHGLLISFPISTGLRRLGLLFSRVVLPLRILEEVYILFIDAYIYRSLSVWTLNGSVIVAYTWNCFLSIDCYIILMEEVNSGIQLMLIGKRLFTVWGYLSTCICTNK